LKFQVPKSKFQNPNSKTAKACVLTPLEIAALREKKNPGSKRPSGVPAQSGFQERQADGEIGLSGQFLNSVFGRRKFQILTVRLIIFSPVKFCPCRLLGFSRCKI